MLEKIKALWRDPKKRPWIIAGAGAAAGAGVLAMRRPTDPEEQVEEENVATEAAPDMGGTSWPTEDNGFLPPATYPSGFPTYDQGLAETDFSEFWTGLDQAASELQDSIDAAQESEREQRRAKDKGLEARLDRQREKTRRQRQQTRKLRNKVNRLENRISHGPKRKPKSKSNPHKGQPSPIPPRRTRPAPRRRKAKAR